MSITMREAIGWLLAMAGLGLIIYVVVLAANRMVLEALAISFPASVVFRVGMGFVRMSVAARIITHAKRDNVM